MLCPACNASNPPQLKVCEKCGSKLPRRSRRQNPEDGEGGEDGEELASMSPFAISPFKTKNPKAVLAYFCGVFGLIPFVGLVLGFPAVILGILGLAQAKADPKVRGINQAMAGIILGMAEILLNAAGIYLMIMGWRMAS